MNHTDRYSNVSVLPITSKVLDQSDLLNNVNDASLDKNIMSPNVATPDIQSVNTTPKMTSVTPKISRKTPETNSTATKCTVKLF